MNNLATHCKSCGQRLPRVALRVPFTVDVLTRIKNGATARELGWDEPFYLSVCRKHGLEPNVYTPKRQAPPEIAASPPISPEPVKPLAPATGPVTFNASTREIARGERRTTLSTRVCDVFVLICKGTPQLPANGRRIAERLSIKHVKSGIGSHVMVIRNRLRALNLSVISQSGRVNSGYWITDLASAIPIVVKVVR